MGGNVFTATHKVVRLNKPEYLNYCSHFETLFKDLGYDSTTYKITVAIKEKGTFGDMDVVVNSDRVDMAYVHTRLDKLGYPTSKNGNVLSFLYNSFQIDLIFVEDKCFNYAWHYLNWNDVGNIIGRLAKQYGLKHGWQGLYYVQRNGDHVVKEHLLSTDYLDVLKCMSLNKHTFFKGFDTYTEMFEWVTNTPRFMPDIFKFENLNHTNKVRDRKRKTYNMFLKHLEEIDKGQFKGNYKLTDEEKTECVCRWFPFVRKEIELVNAQIERHNLIKSKFNGRLVKEITKLEGHQLGYFMTQFKGYYNDDWIYNTELHEIKLVIKKCLTQFKEW